MVLTKRVITVVFLLILLLNLTATGGRYVFAQETEEPVRHTTIVVEKTLYEWWLNRWTDNLLLCQIFVDHEGPPTAEEVIKDCGIEVYEQWRKTPPCEAAAAGEPTTYCTGLYAHFAGYQPGTTTTEVELPPPSVWVDISGCSLRTPENFCTQRPNLVFTAEEPLPDQEIEFIYVVVEGVKVTCKGDECVVPTRSTSLNGTEVEFWADSSFGDSSEHFTALVRVLESGVPTAPTSNGWYVDVLSSQWLGGPVESCSLIWQSFPPPGISPSWLSTPSQRVLLASVEPYQYLAGRLIFQGLVDASECSSNGLLVNGYADACGLDKARPLVDLWQNQFDNRILDVAKETNLPAQLMKNLFAQESQFWPGVFRVPQEYGLGQITDQGADTILLWNEPFYDSYCPLILSEIECSKGYLRLDEEERAILRGSLATAANSDCPECPSGVDLLHTDMSVMLFAQGILANCDQVGQTIYNATNKIPGSVSRYEDLWRFTLANYNGGAGCLAFAVFRTWGLREPMDWDHVSSHLTQPCQGVIAYVDSVTQ
ncbi:MAG: hypothetical protein ABUK20_07385 [Anaerolineales bacterium]